MSTKIALAGNPNCGKTTLFNALTGSNQYVGNWPGVTVEKKEGKLKGNKDVIIMDLPGIYSLSPYTLEEVVARNYLINERPDAIINIIDGTNIERNLYLTTQITELGIPVVIAVNMMDLVEKNGDKIDVRRLSKDLGCEVVEISALKGKGLKEAVEKAVKIAGKNTISAPVHRFDPEVEEALDKIEARLGDDIPKEQKRFFAIKLFERDDKISGLMKSVPDVEALITAVEDSMDDDSESIITNERYNYISNIIGDCYKKKNKGQLSISDKIDKVVTNRFLALPIFALVMILVYYVSVTTVGSWATDWANDGVFGDGWHLFGIGTSQYEEAAGEYDVQAQKMDAFLEAAQAEGISTDAVTEALEAEEGEADESAVIAFEQAAAGVTADAEITDEEGGVVETVTVTVNDFKEAAAAEEPDPADYGVWVPGIPVLIGDGLEAVGCADWLQSLILDGIVAGVGAVLGFVPQILVLFIFLAILEGCGYMARVAFIMDRIFRRFGLSGKSFIPMLIGSGCGVPGIMASRTIENERDRRMTIMTTTFVPCSAKMPIIAMFAGAIFGGAWWVAPSAYFIGIAAIVISGIMLKKTRMFAGEPAPFVIELPAYHVPTVVNVLRSMWERGWSFIKKAGTIILLSTVFIWFTSSFGMVDGSFGMVDDMSDSILAAIGSALAWIFIPNGFGDWQSTVATVTGLVAKENVVGTFGILFKVGSEVAETDATLWTAVAVHYTALSAFSFMVFNLLCAPCFAAMGAIKREMNNAKWFWFAVGYQTGFAYVISLIIYRLGLLFTGGGFSVWTVIATLLLAGIIYLMVRPYKESDTLNINMPAAKAKP
ncbi:ferrous iron transport protein B [Eubacterium maltosivorans]|uniref:ferrous iron transporter B n=1 Tax=Eubacterium maltosivorans TaxID=2041044 RepID=UPI000888CB0A|nr:ferrous iron transporter B [Eubacterium maltosivorans]WPK79462.1 GTPase Der [Eubacterium maltosivorans]SDP11317.1 ferrous iron transport protein B [Eubacterium maltosivorans]